MLGNLGTMYHPQYPSHSKNKNKITNKNKNKNNVKNNCIYLRLV